MKTDYFLGLSEEGFHRVAYTEWGHPTNSNIPIICAHGLTRNGHDFDALATYLSNLGAHVFCPDIVGRGDSDWLKNSLHYTYEQYVADMTALIARTQANQVDWIGTSMGGLLGMLIAAQAHSPIRRLVLNDVGPQIPVKALTRLSKYVGQDPVFISVEAAKQYFKTIYAGFGNLSEEQWQTLTINSIRQIAPNKFISKVDPGVKRSSTKSQFAWNLLLNPHKALEGTFFDIDLWALWRKVKCPVLVIHGMHSDILETTTVEKMQRTHANIEVIEISDAGHAPALLASNQQEVIYHWLMKNG